MLPVWQWRLPVASVCLETDRQDSLASSSVLLLGAFSLAKAIPALTDWQQLNGRGVERAN
jgi:hypothetical protein